MTGESCTWTCFRHREIDPADAPQWDRVRWPELSERLPNGPLVAIQAIQRY